VIPPEANGEFVAHMEDVLDQYHRPYDPKRPLIGMDELMKQLVRETRTPVPMKAGQPERYDYEYERNGVGNVFLFSEPLTGKRWTRVTESRTKIDFAEAIRYLVNDLYPDAECIRLILDNLNTHTLGALYEAFPAAEARRLAQKLEIHYTPKHGSWLNVAEIELSVLSRQCLDRRLPDLQTLEREVAAWQQRRNTAGGRIDWQFTTADARIKLKHLYPACQA
jgi:DDE superfamily endonuclease